MEVDLGGQGAVGVAVVPAGQHLAQVARGPGEPLQPGVVLQRVPQLGRRHLPVLEGGKPVGVISARDFFAAVAGGLEEWIERARYDEKLRENVDPYDHLGGSYGR